MRHLRRVCCPSSAGPTSASFSLQRTSPIEDRSWRFPGRSPGMRWSPLWGSRKAFLTQDGQLVVPPVHRVPGTPVPATRHWVVTCCDRFSFRRPHGVLQRPSRPCPTKLVYEPGFLKTFSKFVSAKSSCVPGEASIYHFPNSEKKILCTSATNM